MNLFYLPDINTNAKTAHVPNGRGVVDDRYFNSGSLEKVPIAVLYRDNEIRAKEKVNRHHSTLPENFPEMHIIEDPGLVKLLLTGEPRAMKTVIKQVFKVNRYILPVNTQQQANVLIESSLSPFCKVFPVSEDYSIMGIINYDTGPRHVFAT